MKRKAFIVFTYHYAEPLSTMTDEQLGKVFRAMFKHNLGEEAKSDDDIANMIAAFLNSESDHCADKTAALVEEVKKEWEEDIEIWAEVAAETERERAEEREIWAEVMKETR